MTQTEHKDTTVGRVVSVESVHVDPAETGPQALSALTHRDILGICYTVLLRPGVWHKTKQNCTGTSCNLAMLLIQLLFHLEKPYIPWCQVRLLQLNNYHVFFLILIIYKGSTKGSY